MSAFRIRTGTQVASAMTSAYNVRAFTVQSDQLNPWFSPVSPSERWRQYDSQTSGGLSGLRRFIGKWNGAWMFNAITPGQVEYLRTTLFPTDGVNEAVTIVTYADGFGWVCIQCNAHWNDPVTASGSRPGSQRLEDFRIDFDEGVIVAVGVGGSHNISHNVSHNRGGIPA
jgi:hypothetical protein